MSDKCPNCESPRDKQQIGFPTWICGSFDSGMMVVPREACIHIEGLERTIRFLRKKIDDLDEGDDSIGAMLDDAESDRDRYLSHVRSLVGMIDEGARCDCWRCNHAERTGDETDRCGWAERFELTVESARKALRDNT